MTARRHRQAVLRARRRRAGPAAAARRSSNRRCAGSDDGELFLEYRESEPISLDDGRIRSAGFDTALGFGLRAVAGEATGYAHAGEMSEAALRRAAATVVGDLRRPFRHRGGAAAGHQLAAVFRRQSAGPDGFLRAHRAAGRDRRLCPRQGPAGQAGNGLADAASGRRCRSSAPTARASPICARWCG